jgi:hypothetical protein
MHGSAKLMRDLELWLRQIPGDRARSQESGLVPWTGHTKNRVKAGLPPSERVNGLAKYPEAVVRATSIRYSTSYLHYRSQGKLGVGVLVCWSNR